MRSRFVFLFLTAALILVGTGCRSTKQTPLPKNIAADTAANFQQRWIDKRFAELAAAGQEATAARAQAEREFRENFSYLHTTEPKGR